MSNTASADISVIAPRSHSDHRRLVITTLVYEISMSGKVKSRMLWTATQSHAFPSAGKSNGKMIFLKVVNRDAPLAQAASSSSR